jgi:serine/threonine protein phosphatase 1
MKLIAVGDIHGCFQTLTELLKKVRASLDENEPHQLIFLGDYMDRGPASKQVLDLLISLKEKSDCVILRGNHENMFLDFCEDPYNNVKSKMYLSNGGLETLKSFEDLGKNQSLPEKKYLDFVRAMPLYHKVGKWVFVHAGIDPTIPLEEQSEHNLLWSRSFLKVTTFADDMRVVHGHTPYGNLNYRQFGNQFNLDSGCVFNNWLTAMIIDTETDEFEFIIEHNRDMMSIY